MTYHNIGITLRITSVFADIDRIVAEALGEVPASDDAQPQTSPPAEPPVQPPVRPDAQPDAQTPAASGSQVTRRAPETPSPAKARAHAAPAPTPP